MVASHKGREVRWPYKIVRSEPGREKRIMIVRSALCAMSLAGLVGAGLAHAGTSDILIGLDNKITYGPEGPTNGAPGNDAVLVVDISDPANPKIRASLPLANSLLGPPTNLQITPDGKLGLVANSVVHVQEGNSWKSVPDDKLYVIDLTADPPKLIVKDTVGRTRSG